MKTIIKLRFILSIIIIAAFMLVLKSCKKVDSNANNNTGAAKADLIKAIKEKYGDVSAGIVYNINKPASEYFYKDANGQPVSLYGAGNNKPGGANGPNSPTSCTYDCSNAPKASLLTITYTLDYAERFYICESGDKSNVNVKWTVSVPFAIYNIVAGNQVSAGYVQFTDPSNATTTFTAPYTDMTITYIGVTPGCSTNSTYEVTYKVTNVPNSNFASGTTIAAAIDLANDCSLVGHWVSSGYISAPTFSQDGYLPCNRIDKVFINPPSIRALGNGSISLTCTHPSNFIYVDYHQLEYRQVNGSTHNWDDQTSTPHWGTPSGGGSTVPNFSPFDYVTLSSIGSGSGWWLVRYRNVKTGTCGIIDPSGPPNGFWPNPALWVTEAWYF
jgi:hypothetical protein